MSNHFIERYGSYYEYRSTLKKESLLEKRDVILNLKPNPLNVVKVLMENALQWLRID